MRRFLCPALVLTLALPALAGRVQGGGPEPEQPSRLGALPTAAEWRALIDRDKTLRFTERTAAEAREILGLADISKERKAVALVALGCVGAEGERTRLEQTARLGQGIERLGAILALGEMNAGATALLLDIARGDAALPAECALLAVLRDGKSSGRRRVEEIAYDTADSRSRVARDLLVLALDPAGSAPSPAGALLLRLRYEAAREFGLVEGEAWKVLAVRSLSQDPVAVREIVLGALVGLRRPGLADHLLPELLAGGGTARIRAAVVLMPRELAQLVENGLWAPADAGEWRDLLDEIERQRAEGLMPEVARAALEVPAVRWKALELAAQGGDEPLGPLIALDPSTLAVPERVELADALGALRDRGWMARFPALREDPDVRVRMAALVAAFRQEQRTAEALVAARLDDAEHEEHGPLVVALCRSARDARVAIALENRLVAAEDDERAEIATALCLVGRLAGRSTVRTALSADPPPRGAKAVRLVRALARNGSAEDVQVFRALFPRPEDRVLDVELARTLAEHGDPAVDAILRAALWRGSFDLSLLAAALLVEHGGSFVLMRELQNPPTEAASSDLRRVGWAAGEWGGFGEVERLMRALRAGSPHPAIQGAWLGALAARTR